jgi:DNA-binding PadR family transcriptional regulator
MSEAQSVSDDVGIAPDLTAFQQTILAVLSEEARYGLAIKRELEAYYQSDVNHGRLYPNLDDLVELGLVAKSELDKRTNEYALTEAGHDALMNRVGWICSRFVTDASRADALRDLVADAQQ